MFGALYSNFRNVHVLQQKILNFYIINDDLQKKTVAIKVISIAGSCLW